MAWFMIRSYCFRLQMDARIGRAFEAAMVASNLIYNAALEERIGAWKKVGKSISKFDQFKSLTQIRSDNPNLGQYAANMLRTPLVQIDDAFNGFFARVKRGQTPGFPRFRSIKRLRSFGFIEAAGWTLKGDRLRMKGLPTLRLKMHRPLEGKPLKLTVKRDTRGRWFAVVVVRLPDIYGPVAPDALGLDVGIEALVTDSNGQRYDRVGPERKGALKRSKIEQSMARRRRGSRRWKKSVRRLGALRQREADARRTRHFQVASEIVRSGPGILVLEKLSVKNMTRSARGTVEKPGTNVAAKAGLNRSLQDAGLAQFVQILTDKAESAGRLVLFVDPRNTSQDCSGCNEQVKKTLRQRQHSCPACGLKIHRDHNAARNVLRRGVVVPDRKEVRLSSGDKLWAKAQFS